MAKLIENNEVKGIQLKEGQKVLGVDGNEYEIEKGDYLQESREVVVNLEAGLSRSTVKQIKDFLEHEELYNPNCSGIDFLIIENQDYTSIEDERFYNQYHAIQSIIEENE